MKIRTFYEYRRFMLFEGERDCYILPSIIINFDLKCIVFCWLYLTFEIDILK